MPKKTKKSHSKRALITGISGQDGYYLSKFLINKGYDVYGMIRRTSNDPLIRFGKEVQFLKDNVKLLYGNLRDINTIKQVIDESKPDEIYNLAAQSDVGISFKCPEETLEVNYFGLGRLVNLAMEQNPKVRIYQASSSEMFGAAKPPQNEKTPFEPVSPYAESKLKAHEDFVVGYREKHGLYICSGILFNHESPKRGEHFVTRKITLSLAKIKLGAQSFFELGNLEAKRDWGFAGDYVEAMWKMLQRKKPEDFVIATGESRSVRDFVNVTARVLGIKLSWHGRGLKEVAKDENGKIILKLNKKYHRPVEVKFLLGDSSKARIKLGWKPRLSFDELVEMMAREDLELMNKFLK